ncbi:ketopantoate reductase family protein [Aliidiomarina soli]|uniref:2-dehydropantoate 2-reductase n=1 Tax=Aliidiomarina soli TaxID=1928574 RepID=A0A432WGM9_9GAMM|nr:2-dehydropantoate 2-reductase [Aliidiomarina soli]RUO32986.1 hypothetical protein CWE14_07000 [Aliidiomarina soli]
MNWLIVGHGALASLWAHHLHANDKSVSLITRNANTASSEEDFVLETNSEQQHQRIAAIPWGQLDTSRLDGAQLLIMVKAWQLDAVLQQLADVLAQGNAKPNAIILSHNGLGAADALVQRHPEWPLYDLVTTQGAWRKSPRHTVHAGQGESVIGPRQTAADNACAAPPAWFTPLANALPPLNWEPDILVQRWQKLAINCAINPLASLAGSSNQVLQDSQYNAEIQAICAEVAAVAEVVLGQGRLIASELEARVYTVITATANNTCSMLQDLKQGNPTEIDYLNGYIVQLGAAYGIPTPVNQRLYSAIKALQV